MGHKLDQILSKFLRVRSLGSGCGSVAGVVPEVHGSNPVIGKNLYWTFAVSCIEKTKIEKRGRVLPILRKKSKINEI